MLLPGQVRPRVQAWPALARALVERVRREAIGGVLPRGTAALLEEVHDDADVAAALAAAPDDPLAPVVPVEVTVEGPHLQFFSVVSTVGSPQDVTAQELRVEAFFPADDATRAAWPGVRWPG